MTVRERALELLHEVAGLLEQLLGEVEENEGDPADPEGNVDPERTSRLAPELDPAICRQGGVHREVMIGPHTYCEKCNKLLQEGTS